MTEEPRDGLKAKRRATLVDINEVRREKARRRSGRRPLPKSTTFNSLDVHLAALRRPCPRCGEKMYRDSWGDPPNQVKLHTCALCGLQRAVHRKDAHLLPLT